MDKLVSLFASLFFFKTLPFDFDYSTNCVNRSSGRVIVLVSIVPIRDWRISRCYAGWLTLFLSGTFNAVQKAQFLETTLNEKAISLIWVIGLLYGSSLQWHTIRHREDLGNFINRFQVHSKNYDCTIFNFFSWTSTNEIESTTNYNKLYINFSQNLSFITRFLIFYHFHHFHFRWILIL
jgi:hypothetical protein